MTNGAFELCFPKQGATRRSPIPCLTAPNNANYSQSYERLVFSSDTIYFIVSLHIFLCAVLPTAPIAFASVGTTVCYLSNSAWSSLRVTIEYVADHLKREFRSIFIYRFL